MTISERRSAIREVPLLLQNNAAACLAMPGKIRTGLRPAVPGILRNEENVLRGKRLEAVPGTPAPRPSRTRFRAALYSADVLRIASARYLPCCFRQAMKASRFASSVGGYRPSVG